MCVSMRCNQQKLSLFYYSRQNKKNNKKTISTVALWLKSENKPLIYQFFDLMFQLKMKQVEKQLVYHPVFHRSPTWNGVAILITSRQTRGRLWSSSSSNLWLISFIDWFIFFQLCGLEAWINHTHEKHPKYIKAILSKTIKMSNTTFRNQCFKKKKGNFFYTQKLIFC